MQPPAYRKPKPTRSDRRECWGIGLCGIRKPQPGHTSRFGPKNVPWSFVLDKCVGSYWSVTKTSSSAATIGVSIAPQRCPLSDSNVLRRHLRPAAIKLGLDPKKATWPSLRTSCATWMVEAGANLKDVQGQMRHARISTTMEIYAQYVPDSQRRAIERTMAMVETRRAQLQQLQSTRVN